MQTELPEGMTKRGRTYWADFRHGGQRVRKSLSRDLKTAKRLLIELRARMERGGQIFLDAGPATLPRLDPNAKGYLSRRWDSTGSRWAWPRTCSSGSRTCKRLHPWNCDCWRPCLVTYRLSKVSTHPWIVTGSAASGFT